MTEAIDRRSSDVPRRTARLWARRLTAVLAVALASSVALGDPSPPHVQPLDIHRWRVVQRESGPTNYYLIVEAQPPYLRGHFTPGMETTLLGVVFTDAERAAVQKVRWRWRAEALPTGGSECTDGHEDSAASVYLTWKRGLRWYTLKYVWSPVDKPGAVCHSIRNPFVAQDTVVLESGGPVATWANEEIDLKAEFRRHFEGNDPNADVPELLGIGLMSDGDQTNSVSAADYGDFAIVGP